MADAPRRHDKLGLLDWEVELVTRRGTPDGCLIIPGGADHQTGWGKDNVLLAEANVPYDVIIPIGGADMPVVISMLIRTG